MKFYNFSYLFIFTLHVFDIVDISNNEDKIINKYMKIWKGNIMQL